MCRYGSNGRLINTIEYDENERAKSEEITNKSGTSRRFNYRYDKNEFIVRKVRRDFDSEGNKIGMKFWTFDPETGKLERKTTLTISPFTNNEIKRKEKNYRDEKLQSKYVIVGDESRGIDFEDYKYIDVNLEEPIEVYESKTIYDDQTIKKLQEKIRTREMQEN